MLGNVLGLYKALYLLKLDYAPVRQELHHEWGESEMRKLPLYAADLLVRQTRVCVPVWGTWFQGRLLSLFHNTKLLNTGHMLSPNHSTPGCVKATGRLGRV